MLDMRALCPLPPYSYLKMLSGRMHATKNVMVEGEVTYNGHTFDEFNVIRTAAYVGQVRGCVEVEVEVCAEVRRCA
jgi:hypothetical protein